MIRHVLFCSVLLGGAFFCGCGSLSGGGLSLRQDGRQAVVRTERLEATFADGKIVSCHELASGTVFAEPGNDAGKFPVGIGCLKDQIKELRKMHVPWGSVELNQHLTDKNSSLFLYPDELSTFTVEPEKKQWRLTWSDLSNGRERFPDSRLTFLLGCDENEELTRQAEGEVPQGGIFGIQPPLANIPAEARFVFPHFVGMEFHHRPTETLSPFGGAPFWEAPVAALEIQDSAMAMWMENPTFSQYYTYFKNLPIVFFFAFELNSLMPVEDKKQYQSPIVKLDIFPGDWKTAMTPFRNGIRQPSPVKSPRATQSPGGSDQADYDGGANYEKVAATFPRKQSCITTGTQERQNSQPNCGLDTTRRIYRQGGENTFLRL